MARALRNAIELKMKHELPKEESAEEADTQEHKEEFPDTVTDEEHDEKSKDDSPTNEKKPTSRNDKPTPITRSFTPARGGAIPIARPLPVRRHQATRPNWGAMVTLAGVIIATVIGILWLSNLQAEIPIEPAGFTYSVNIRGRVVSKDTTGLVFSGTVPPHSGWV